MNDELKRLLKKEQLRFDMQHEELIKLMDKMSVYQKENERLKQKVNQLETNWNELKGWLRANDIHYAEAIPFRETLRKMQELEGDSNE